MNYRDHFRTFVTFLFFSSMVISPVSGQEKNGLKNPIYPLDVGTKWVFQNGAEKITVSVEKHEKIGEDLCAVLVSTSKNSKKIEYLTVKEDGIYRVKAGNTTYEPVLKVLPLPFKAGLQWDWSSKGGMLEINGKFNTLSKKEKLTLPWNKKMIEALCIKSKDLKLGSRPIEISYWLVEDMGIVQQSIKIAGIQVTLRIVEFSKPK